MSDFDRNRYADADGFVHIVVGTVTDTEAHPGAALGDVEYQFSDGPPGQRGCSVDYVSLTQGMRDFAGWPIVYHGAE